MARFGVPASATESLRVQRGGDYNEAHVVSSAESWAWGKIVRPMDVVAWRKRCTRPGNGEFYERSRNHFLRLPPSSKKQILKLPHG